MEAAQETPDLGTGVTKVNRLYIFKSIQRSVVTRRAPTPILPLVTVFLLCLPGLIPSLYPLCDYTCAFSKIPATKY
jgi:hypothetical protein